MEPVLRAESRCDEERSEEKGECGEMAMAASACERSTGRGQFASYSDLLL